LVPHDTDIEHISGLAQLVWRKSIGKSAMQPPTEVFEQVQAHIWLAHLDPMEGGFRNP
jgi:hypothetical protein